MRAVVPAEQGHERAVIGRSIDDLDII